MNFKPSDIDFITWAMRQADWPRAQRRVKIDEMANGVPPYTKKEEEENRIPINFNDLSHTRELHNARAQFTQSFMKPGSYFTARTDAGRRDKREGYGRIVTTNAAKVMKKSLPYFETQRSKWAATVLHGISPCVFEDQDHWEPRPLSVGDVMVPSNTQLIDIAKNTVPFVPIYRSFTGPQLIKLAKGPTPDPAWQQDMVDACLKWIDSQTMQLASNNWPEFWSPEKWEDRIKGDGAIYSSDQVPVINAWDFYFWNDSNKVQGWNRRMILDAWSMPNGPAGVRTRRTEPPFDGKDRFLYDPGDRVWSRKLSEIINWQFADLSAVSPFRYHTVRSLGYLLYAVCQIQNRLRCKVNAAMFEQLMVLLRVNTQDDMQRALSVNFVDYGVVDDSIKFIPPSERYQVNAQLAQMGLTENANLISRNSSSFTSRPPSSGDRSVPTATQWMGEEAKVTQLVSAGLMQAYEYQKPEYLEIFRRLTKRDTTDIDARRFQLNCLRDGVPPKVLYNLESWDIDPERVLGAGNKTLEMAITQQLMAYRNLYDPPTQRKILYDATLAITDDPVRAEMYVPPEPQVSDSIHDAQLSVGTLLVGQPMAFRANANHGEYAGALLDALEVEIAKINASGGVTGPEQLTGLQNLAGQTIQGQPVPGNGIAAHIQAFAMDPEAKGEVKILADRLAKAMNEVRAFAQRMMEQQQQGNGAPQMDPEAMAKIQSMQMQAEAKAANTRESHAQRTAQRQVSFEMEQQRKDAQTQAEIARENARFTQEVNQDAIKTVAELEKQKLAEANKIPTGR